MKAKAEGILAKITKFEEEYKKHEQLLDSNTVRSIDIQRLRAYKESVNNYLKRIEKLGSEDAPPLPESVGHYTYDDPNAAVLTQRADEYQRVFNLRREYIQVPRNLASIENLADDLMKHLEPFKASVSSLSTTVIELVQKKGQYIELSQSIESDIDRDTTDFASISSAYLADSVLKESLQKVQLQQAGYSNLLELLKKDTVEAGADASKQLAAYDNGLQLLQEYQQTYKKSTEKLRKKISVLTSAESVYKEVVVSKDAMVKSAKRSIGSVNFLLGHEDLTQTKKITGFSVSASELSDLVKKVAAKTQEIENKNYMAQAGLVKPPLTPFKKINKATTLCLDDKNELTQLVDTLNKKAAEVDQQINETAKQVKRDIEEQKKEFSKIASAIKIKLTTEKVGSFAIRKLEAQFEIEGALTNSANQNSIAFDQAKLTRLKEITQTLEKQVLVEEKRIIDEIGKNIGIIAKDITVRQAGILDTVAKGGFNVTEHESFSAVRDYKFTLDAGNEQNREILSDKLKQAHKEKERFDKLYGELYDIVALHKAAKPIADKISANSLSAQELAEMVNECPEDGKLLTALGQYYDGLTGALNKHLALFDAKGISAVKAFVKYGEEPLDTSISGDEPLSFQQRLALITFLSEAKVDYKPFLAQNEKNKEITAAVFYLKEQKLPGLITAKNLGNKPFLDALLVLKKHKINLSEEYALSLASDLNKCEVICQQNELYKNSQKLITNDTSEIDKRIRTDKIEEATFKALIEDFLQNDKEVTAAVNMVSKHAPEYCQHWLLAMVKESKPLQNLLNNDLKSNLPFIKIMFDDALKHNSYLKKYFTKKAPDEGFDPHKWAAVVMKRTLERNDLLTQLEAASVGKMGVVMEEINQFILNNRKPNTQENQAINDSLSRFRREAAPILLATNSTSEKKKEALEELADKHFKNTSLLDLALEFLFEVFEKIAVNVFNSTKLSEHRSTFFSTQKVAALDHLRKGFEHSAAEVEVTDEESESLESDLLIHKGMNQ